MLYKRLLCVLLALAASGCVKDKLDFDMADDIRLRPELEIPLVNARLTFADIIAKDTNQVLVVDPDDFVRISYKRDYLFGYSSQDLVKIPDQDPTNFPIVVGQPPLSVSMAMGTIGNVELGPTEFYEGDLEMTLTSLAPLTDDVEVEITILNSDNGGQPLKQSVTLPSGNTSAMSTVAIPGYSFDLSNGGQNVNYFGISLEVVNPPAALTGSMLDLQLQFKGLTLEEATGYFGDRVVKVPSGNFDLDISGVEKLSNGLKIQNPSVKMIVASTYGVPLSLSIDFDGVNHEGQITSLGAQTQVINGAASVNAFDTTVLEFNGSNSQIADFIAALPTSVLYSGEIALNPNGYTTNNFLNRNSAIEMGIDIDLPLELSIDNMLLQEELTGIDIFSENPEELEEVTLIFNSSNGFPFDLDLQVAFIDSVTGDSIHGFSLGLLKAATVDANGNILQRGELGIAREIYLDKNILKKLESTKTIAFRAILNTPQNGQKVERFYTHYDLTVKIGAKTKLNINPNNP